MRCRTCGRAWPVAYKRCPDDGGELDPPSTFADVVPDDHDATVSGMSVAARSDGSTEKAPLLGSMTEIVPRAANVGVQGSVVSAFISLTEIEAPYAGSLTGRAQLDSSSGPAARFDERRAARAVTTTDSTGSLAIVGSDELEPGTPVSEYLVEEKIGQGAMGAVYSARHPAIGKRVAIKVMTPRLSREHESVERFVGEARAVAAIRHPGIVDVFGFGSLPDGRLYLIMELLHGECLRDCLVRSRLGLVEGLDLLDQMARALEAAHDDGIIHRDLKPENVFLERVAKEPRPIVKILDFGLAKLIGSNDERVRRTQTGQLLGTPLYMSPEQCKAKGVDHRTDIYALGCIAYELFCGRVPFDFDNVAEVISAQLSEPPPSPRALWPEIPSALDGLLVAMLAKDPRQRPTLEMLRQTISTVRTLPIRNMPRPVARPWPTPVPGRWESTPVPQPLAAVRTDGTSSARTGTVARTTLGTSTGELQAQRAPASRSRLMVGGSASLAIVAVLVVVVVTRARRSGDEPARRGPEVVSALPLPPPAKPTPALQQRSEPSSSAIPANTAQEAGSAVTTPKAASRPDTSRPGTSRHGERAIRGGRPGVEAAINKPVAAATEVATAEPTTGTLTLDSTPPCNIYVDGKALGLQTPQPAIKLPVGRHQITLVNANLKVADSFSVEIRPGSIENAFKHYEPTTDGATTINPFPKQQPGTSP